MPPKVKITKEKIIDAATEIVRVVGSDALNARALATSLGASTQPIFSCFASMNEVRDAVSLRANALYEVYLEEMIRGEAYPPYTAMGMGYIKFAREERELFKLLFMTPAEPSASNAVSDRGFGSAVERIMGLTGFSREVAETFHCEMWSFVHGVAVMCATDFLTLDDEKISSMMTDVYQGLLTRNKEKCK